MTEISFRDKQPETMLFRKRFYHCTKDGRFKQVNVTAILTGSVLLFVLLVSTAIFGIRSHHSPVPGNKTFHALEHQIEQLESQLESLSASDNRLRLAVNLPVEEEPPGTGGSRSVTFDDSPSAFLLEETEKKIELLSLRVEAQKKSHEKIRRVWTKNQDYFASLPALKPINSPVSSRFGHRTHPIYKRRLHHDGIDFSAPHGSKIHAPGNGVVRYTGYHGGYGKKVVIDHGYGYKTVYAHLSKILVKPGQRVVRGEVIALSGNTGISTGPHLHYEVHRNNRKVNPSAYFFDDFTPENYLTAKPALAQSDSNS